MKTVLKSLLVLLLLLLLGVAALFFWLDPNIFKPRIKALAAEQGIALEIAGDIRWQFWPSIGIEVQDISVAAASAPADQLAQLRSASLLVAARPLFDRQLQVEHLIIDGAKLVLEFDQAGVSNWSRVAEQAKLKAEQTPTQWPDDAAAQIAKAKQDAVPQSTENDSPSDSGGQVHLAVDAISITDAQLSYRDVASARSAEVNINALKLTGFNLEDRPFTLNGDWRVRLADPALFAERVLQVAGKLSTSAQLSTDLGQVLIRDGSLALDISGLGESALVSTEFELSIKNLAEQMMLNGHLALAPVNIKKLLASLGQSAPDMADPNALTKLSFDTNFSGSARSMTFAPLTMVLDQTTVNGELSVTDFEQMALVVTLAGDRINLDHYLPPEPEVKPTTSDTTLSGDEPLIPLEVMRALNARVRVDLNEAIFSGLTMQNLRLRLNAADGLVQLTEASLNAYDGQLQASGKLDARGSSARINANADMIGLNVAPLLKDLELDQELQLNGLMNLDLNASTTGLTMNQLLQAALAEVNFSGAEVTLAPINVEQYFCQAIDLAKDLRSKDADKQTHYDAEPTVSAGTAQHWPKFTAMHDLQGQAQLREQKITIKSFTAGVEQLLLGLNGEIDLGGQSFDLRLPFTLEQQSTSPQGCTVNSNYWFNRSLSLLRCRGSFDTLAPAKDCRLDSKSLESLLGDYAKQRLQKELIRKFGSEDKNAKGEEETDSTKAAVKGLLNQFLNKDKNKQQDTKNPE